MRSSKKASLLSLLITGLLFLSAGAVASGIQAAMGDEVRIAGYATSGPYVYLFLTGPNLPVNGVALHDISKRAELGGFTKVSVDGDDHWEYRWHTGSIGGRLDEGTYMVWVVSGPNDRSRLATADFRTIDVTLKKPSISVDTPVQPGGMDLQSVPDGASLVVNGEFHGKTPLTIRGLSPGNYVVTFTRFGFTELSTQVMVAGGKISEVTATLQPKTGTLVVNSSPSGARVLLDGTPAGLSPLILENISADTHTLGLSKDGYVTVTRQISIEAGQVSRVEAGLEPVSLPPATTRAAGLVLSTAGALCMILLGSACIRRRNR